MHKPNGQTNPGPGLCLTLVLASSLASGSLGCGDDGPGDEPDAATDSAVTADAQVDAEVPFEIDPERVYEDIEALAATELAGRAPGTPGNEAAMAMVETLFGDLGLLPAGEGGTYRQTFQYDSWAPIAAPAVALGGTALEYDADYALLSYSGSVDVTAEIVFVGYGLTVPPFDATQFPECPLPSTGYDDYEGVDVTGRVALVLRHGPDDNQTIYNSCPANEACDAPPCLWNFGYKTANARLHGAAAVLLVQDYRHPAGEIIQGNIGLEYYREDLGALFLDRTKVEAAIPDLPSWASSIDSSGAPESRPTGVQASVFVSTEIAQVECSNILGALEGQDGQIGHEVVVLGAHLDHLGEDPFSGSFYPGADDNASGTAVMMELARAFAHAGPPLARTLLFAAWNAEEAGLIGSYFYTQHPTYPLEDTILAFSVDMVGLGDGLGVDVYGGTSYRSLVTAMQRSVADAGQSWAVVANLPLDASDHAVFVLEGIPGVLISSTGDHATYHTPADGAWGINLASLEATLGVMWPTLQTYGYGMEAQYQKSAWRPLAPSAPVLPDALHPRLRDK